MTAAEVCRAPFTSLFLDTRGNVQACCMNDLHQLGNVTQASLEAIWFGDSADRLRSAVAAGDLGLGCEPCAREVDRGRPDLAYARTFDAVPSSGGDPAWPTQLDLSLSNACNLSCVMCNGEWSSTIRAHREHRPALPEVYGDAFFAELAARFLPHLTTVNVRGGEPFLAGATLRLLDLLADASRPVTVGVTTNATQWTPRVERILDRLPIDLAVSLDAATAATYESIRVGARWDDVRANLSRLRGYTREAGTTLSVSFCLMTVNWHELAAFCRLADELEAGAVVNTVTHPAALSLFRLPLDEAAGVLAALEVVDRDEGHLLGASRRVWEAELHRLRAHVEQGEPVPMPRRRAPLPAGVACLEVDEGGVVRATTASETALGIPAAALTGAHAADLPEVLARLLGPVAAHGPIARPDGHNGHEVRFDDGRRLVVDIDTDRSAGIRHATVLLVRWAD